MLKQIQLFYRLYLKLVNLVMDISLLQHSGDVMDVSNVSGAQVQQVQNTQSQAANLVQKKSEEIQEQTTQQLIDEVPDPNSSVGQNVNITV